MSIELQIIPENSPPLADELELTAFANACCVDDPNRLVKVRQIEGQSTPEQDQIDVLREGYIRYFLPSTAKPPYNAIERWLFRHPHGFILCTVNMQNMLTHPALNRYFNKYQAVYDEVARITNTSIDDLSVPICWIELLGVHPDHRNSGLGTDLIHAAETECAERFGGRYIFAGEVASTKGGHTNQDAYRYYSSAPFGFKIIIHKGALIGFKAFV